VPASRPRLSDPPRILATPRIQAGSNRTGRFGGEFTKIRSVRSTYWTLLMLLAVSVEERVDDVLVALVAALQPVKGIVPGVGPLDVPSLSRLDGGLVALMGDFPVMPRPASSSRVFCES
jgi:hypothetical protein